MNIAVKYKSKVFVVSIVCIFLLMFLSQHYAQSFVDEKMLQRLQQEYSKEARRRGVALSALLKRLEGKKVNKQLIEVNRFFNQFKYKNDIDLWGRKDYWATPEEFIGVNSGDCEDYVMAKYFALRSLGVPDKNLYLTYVTAQRQNSAHMVLSYFPNNNSATLILDNFNPRILTAEKRFDLTPVYSFNAQSLFSPNASAGLGDSLPTEKIKNSRWKKFLANIKRSRP